MQVAYRGWEGVCGKGGDREGFGHDNGYVRGSWSKRGRVQIVTSLISNLAPLPPLRRGKHAGTVKK